jgi:hypothetical protein
VTTWGDRLTRVEDAISAWRPRLINPLTPEFGSSLAKDDETFPTMPCSQLAWWGLSTAVEHLDASLRLIADQTARGGPYFSDANYTLLRAGLLGASQAAVLLLPPSRQLRTTYGLQLAHEEFRRALNVRNNLHQHDGLPEGIRAAASDGRFLDSLTQPLARAAALLDERGARKGFPDTDLIAAAGQLVHTPGPDAQLLQLGQEMEWSLGSGSAHGQLLVSMHRAGGHRTEGNVAMFAGDYDSIAQTASRVCLVASEAWRAWDLRRLR